MTEEEHQFGDQGFDCTVITADDTGIQQMQTGFITSHFHHASRTLRDVDNHDSPFGRLFQELDEPRLLRCIARTVSLEHHGTKSWCMEDVADDVLIKAIVDEGYEAKI